MKHSLVYLCLSKLPHTLSSQSKNCLLLASSQEPFILLIMCDLTKIDELVKINKKKENKKVIFVFNENKWW